MSSRRIKIDQRSQEAMAQAFVSSLMNVGGSGASNVNGHHATSALKAGTRRLYASTEGRLGIVLTILGPIVPVVLASVEGIDFTPDQWIKILAIVIWPVSAIVISMNIGQPIRKGLMAGEAIESMDDDMGPGSGGVVNGIGEKLGEVSRAEADAFAKREEDSYSGDEVDDLIEDFVSSDEPPEL